MKLQQSQISYFALGGGLDQITPPLKVAPGKVMSALNYEQFLSGGYRRIDGFERYNGLPKPSEALTNADAEIRRTAISAVPGSGPILGVWIYGGKKYAFRDNAGATQAVMYEATGSGWVAVTGGGIFTAGAYFEFINYNFGGHASTNMMYGCNGANKAFQFDGTTITVITTGMTSDAPTHIAAFKMHLFLSFTGGSLQHSSIGDPLTWSVITGAGEIGIGDEISALQPHLGVMFVQSRNSTYIFQGSSSLDWTMEEYSNKVGALEKTTQVLNDITFLDDRGVATMKATQAFGNFTSGTLSALQQITIDEQKYNATAATVSRSKDQYRLFFEDGSALYFTMRGSEMIGAMPIHLGMAVRCVCSGEDSVGEDVIFFGSDDGYVYQMDSGNNFDGEEITAYLRLPFNNLKSPQHYKRFLRATLELDAGSNESLTLYFVPEFSYGNRAIPVSGEIFGDVDGGGGYWDEAIWDEFYYDSQIIGEAEARIDGSGLNMSMLIRSVSTYETPHILYGVLLRYIKRGLRR